MKKKIDNNQTKIFEVEIENKEEPDYIARQLKEEYLKEQLKIINDRNNSPSKTVNSDERSAPLPSHTLWKKVWKNRLCCDQDCDGDDERA